MEIEHGFLTGLVVVAANYSSLRYATKADEDYQVELLKLDHESFTAK